MKRLPLSLRLLLSTLVFSVPIITLIVLMYKSETVNIDFSEKEVLGNRLQRPFEKAFEAAVISRLTGEGNAETEKAFEGLEKEYSSLKEDLQFTKEGLGSRKRENASVEALRGFWKEKKWDDLVAGFRLGITHLGDTSNLILDPDLDSYYLMDITLLALPQMQDRLQSILSQRGQWFETKDVPESARIQAALFASMLEEADLGRVVGDSQTVLNEDPNFYGANPSFKANWIPKIEALTKDSKVFIELLRKISRSEKVEEKDFFQAGLTALKGSFSTWNSSVDELDTLLQTRLTSLTDGRRQSLMTSALALCLALCFSTYIGFTLSSTLRQMRESVMRLKDAATQSSSLSQQLKDTSQEVSNSVDSQASSIETTAASVEEINSMVTLNAENSKSASSFASTASQSAQSGAQEIKKMLSSMSEISESSKKIGEIMTVIDDIAFQTNLLALNASVEAARAGEHGKGFAVVADAVRSLAQKSASSAKDINELIKENASVIAQGRKGADTSVKIFEEILTSITKVNQLNNEIATAAVEQSTGITQISQAMQVLENQTEQNRVSMSNVHEYAQNMATQSRILEEIIRVLESEIHGRRVESLNHETSFARPEPASHSI